MFNKIFLFAFAVCSFGNAAMVGDFSPMKVGNTWVYSVDSIYTTFGTYDILFSENKIVKIISMRQNKDSLLYTVVDSTFKSSCSSCVPIINTKVFLELNNDNFVYDGSTKTFTPIGTFYSDTNFGFCFQHQLPDSTLTKVTFASQNLFSYSLITNTGGDPHYYTREQWIQNYGLYDYYAEYDAQIISYIFEIKLVSFNGQLVGNPITAITSKNMGQALSENQNILVDTHNQIHWRGLSAADRLNIQVYDCHGKLFFSSRQLPGTYVLNASQFSSKAYIFRYKVNNGVWKNFSLVKN
ncbi:MAG: hypothetical protein WBM07_18760 [Chitinivibrionales bacterium]